MRHTVFFLRILTKQMMHILRHRKQEEQRAEKILHSLEKQFHGQFDPFTFQKIKKSYAIYLLMFCDAFTQLYGRETTAEEKHRLVLYFLCSSIFDDFCDRKPLGTERLEQISFKQDSFHPKDFDERVFLFAHKYLLEIVKDQKSYITVSHQLYQAQIASFAQDLPEPLTNDDLEKITLDKGGYSVLISGFYLQIPMSDTLRKCYFEIGSIIQVINDLFDIYKDLQVPSQTLPNRIQDVATFEIFFSRLVNNLEASINELPFDQSRKKNFYFSMMAICSFGYVAIHQLKGIQENKPQLPQLNTLPRKALIIDMEKWENMRFCIHFCYKKLKTFENK